MLKFDSEPEQQLAVFVPVRFYFWFLFLKILYVISQIFDLLDHGNFANALRALSKSLLEFSGLFYYPIIKVLLFAVHATAY